jgi:hypothetical protein
MSQTSYADPDISLAGSPYGIEDHVVRSRVNGEASASMPFGVAVTESGSGVEKLKLPTAVTDKIAGITMRAVNHDNIGLGGTTLAIKAGDRFDALQRGAIYVPVEQTVARGDEVWVRIATSGSDPTNLTQKGAFRKDGDGAAELQTLTPTAANTTLYKLKVFARGQVFKYETTSDGSATATEICDAFRVLMAADLAFTALFTTGGTTTLTLTRKVQGEGFTVVSDGAGAIAVAVTTPATQTAIRVPGAKYAAASSGGLAPVDFDHLAANRAA